MGITLREHQVEAIANADIEFSKLANQVIDGLQVQPNVCLVLPTGAGKTIVKAEYARRCRDKGEPCIIFAHRDVLLGQISDALCLMGVHHSFIVANNTLREITDDNRAKYNGNSFYDATSHIVVASVDKFRAADVSHIAPMFKMWMLDETHHLTKGSKWAKCIDKLPNARGLGVTATPIRGDKKGLGREYDGLFDAMVVGTDMGTLIQRGKLSAYKIFTPPPKVDVEGMRATASGDYNQKELAKRTDNSSITGDVIHHYRKHADGKQTICFCVNIEHSRHVAAQFREAGIEAVALSSMDTAAVRKQQIDKFKAGITKVLVNCDLFGEGFDVPAVECVIMLRKTMSYSLFKQQFGRCLRVIGGKEYGILLDHVGNVEYHMLMQGLTYPHDDPEWTLARQSKSNSQRNPKPIRVCPDCFAYYIPKNTAIQVCPECHVEETKEEAVAADKKFMAKQGDLVELTFEQKEAVKKKLIGVNENPMSKENAMKQAGMSNLIVSSARKKHIERANAQSRLRRVIVDWCNLAVFNCDLSRDQMHDAFEVTFGMDILTAQCLSASEATELRERIYNHEGYGNDY